MENNTVTIEKTVQKAGRILGTISLTRDERTGHALLYIKSDIKADPLRGVGTLPFAGITCYKAKITELMVNNGTLRVYFNYEMPGAIPTPFYNGFAVVQPLLAKSGLAEGVTFDFGSLPLPASEWRAYLQALKHTLRYVYASYYQPLNMTVELTSVERLDTPEAATPLPVF